VRRFTHTDYAVKYLDKTFNFTNFDVAAEMISGYNTVIILKKGIKNTGKYEKLQNRIFVLRIP